MAALITAASTVVASARQVSCKFDREAALLQLDDGIYYGLDPVGARIWELVQQQCTVAQLRDQVCAEYDVDAVACERDLLELLHALAEARLIDVS